MGQAAVYHCQAVDWDALDPADALMDELDQLEVHALNEILEDISSEATRVG